MTNPQAKAWYRIRPLRQVLALSLATGSLVGAAQGCGRPSAEFPKVASPSDDCWEQHRVELLLGELGVRVMQTYGRIDPQLLRIDPESGTLRPPEPESIRDKDAFAKFEQALKEVNADDAARRTFRAGQASAVTACGSDGCPSTVFLIDVTTKTMPDGSPFHHWLVKDESAPTAAAWHDGFLRQYSYLSPQCCPLQPVLVVPDPEHAEAATAQADFAKGLGSGASDKSFRTGAARVSGPCYAGSVKKSCDVTCEKKKDVFGKWVQAGSNTICCTC